MRVLITGATGFAGGWLAAELARAYPDARLWGTTHATHPRAEEHLPPNLRLLPCDLTKSDAVRAALDEAKPNVVFHLAGFASGAGGDRNAIFRVNVEATVGLLQALSDRGQPCRALLASSGYVYGVTTPGKPATESDTPAFMGEYAESKAAMETAIRRFASDQSGGPLSLTVVRSFNHTGPRQTTEFVVPAFARQIARIERGLEPPVVRVGNLAARRDFLHVRDVVRAYRLLICEGEPAPWRIVNVASGNAVTIRSLLDTLIAQATLPMTVEIDPARVRPVDLPECAGDASLLASLTGWHAEIGHEQMLAETLGWWRETVANDLPS